MCWGYVAGRVSSSVLGTQINPYMIILLAALPDIDLLLGVFGIQHRTWTHSILFWTVAFVPIFVKYRKRGLPYFISPIQHILFGDAIVGAYTRPLWPLSGYNIALDHSLLSIENIVLEGVGLAIALILIFATKNGRQTLSLKNNSSKMQHLIICLPIIFLLAFLIFVYSYDRIADVLVANGLLEATRLLQSIPTVVKHQLFPIAVAMHIVLIIALLVPLLSKFVIRNKEKPVDSKY